MADWVGDIGYLTRNELDLWVYCACGAAKLIDSRDLEQRLGPTVTVNRLMTRHLRCSACGARPTDLRLAVRHANFSPVGRKIAGL